MANTAKTTKNTSISLGSHFEQFISSQLKTGKYGSVSEIVRAGLRMLEENEIKLQKLRTELVEGERSGYAEYDYNALMDELNNDSR